MWLSRLGLDVRRPAVRKALSDVNFLHQQVLAAFPTGVASEAPRQSLGVLFRLDRTREGALVLLVQSTSKPDWAHLRRDGWLVDDVDGFTDNPGLKEWDPGTVAAGQPLRFRLRANPTKKVDTKTGADGKKRNGRRVVLTSEAERLGWLERKATQHGFRVLETRQSNPGTKELLDVSEGRVTGNRPQAAEGQRTLTFGSVLFEGRLEVVDATLFRQALEAGIGSGKAFGFGLLSIAQG